MEIKLPTEPPLASSLYQHQPANPGHWPQQAEPTASNIAADLSVLFPADRYRIKTRVVTRGTRMLESSGNRKPVLFSPRVWDSLDPEERNDSRAIKVVYTFTEEKLEKLGASFGWRRRRRLRRHG